MRGTAVLKLLGLSTSAPSFIARIRPTVALIRPGCFAEKQLADLREAVACDSTRLSQCGVLATRWERSGCSR